MPEIRIRLRLEGYKDRERVEKVVHRDGDQQAAFDLFDPAGAAPAASV